MDGLSIMRAAIVQGQEAVKLFGSAKTISDMRTTFANNVATISQKIGATVNIWRAILIGTGFVIVMGPTLSNGQGNKQAASNPQQIERGRYVVEIGGCNDCHTAGYAEA